MGDNLWGDNLCDVFLGKNDNLGEREGSKFSSFSGSTLGVLVVRHVFRFLSNIKDDESWQGSEYASKCSESKRAF